MFLRKLVPANSKKCSTLATLWGTTLYVYKSIFYSIFQCPYMCYLPAAGNINYRFAML